MIAQALWHLDNANSELRAEEIQISNNSNTKLIHTTYSMLSTGTEFLVAAGFVDNIFEEKMTVPYMGGHFNFPIKYGYACSGKDEDGKLYHFMHPHQDKCILDKNHLFEIENLSPLKTPLISNVETVLNAIWDADLRENDKIAIIGYGNVGSLLGQTLKSYQNKTATIIETNDWRMEQANKNGFEVNSTFDEKYDVIFNTSSSNKALNAALKALNVEGKLVELSWYGNKTVTLSLGLEFHYNRLQIISSQVSQIPKKLQPEMNYLKRKQLAAKILEDPAFDYLITDIIDFKNAPSFFNDLRNKKISNGLIYLFKY